jgi:dihydrofolate reductase
MQTLALIVATANNGVIGVNNTLPWHLPEDLKRFRALTTGHHIIMGRKTYESLGRLLPNRTSVIVTKNPEYQVAGALIASSLDSAIKMCQGDDSPFIIGGATLYQSALALVDTLHITKIDVNVDGDAYFPEIDLKVWQETSQESHVSADGLSYQYLTYTKKTI